MNFIPDKINVGFQNREDTYTNKLAYIIYYDEKGKLRKETSWNSWRDKKIDPIEYINEPTEGFVLNKKVGGYRSYYNTRQTYTRVFDPRGFEFEIDIVNLLFILENTSSIKGKGLEGEFVYAWQGKELVLLPLSCPDYEQWKKDSKAILNKETIKAKDLIVGRTYRTKQDQDWIYLGRYPIWERKYDYETREYKDLAQKKVKPHWFGTVGDETKESKQGYSWSRNIKNLGYSNFHHIQSVPQKIIACTNEEESPHLGDWMNALNHSSYFSKEIKEDYYLPYTNDEIEDQIHREGFGKKEWRKEEKEGIIEYNFNWRSPSFKIYVKDKINGRFNERYLGFDEERNNYLYIDYMRKWEESHWGVYGSYKYTYDLLKSSNSINDLLNYILENEEGIYFKVNFLENRCLSTTSFDGGDITLFKALEFEQRHKNEETQRGKE